MDVRVSRSESAPGWVRCSGPSKKLPDRRCGNVLCELDVHALDTGDGVSFDVAAHGWSGGVDNSTGIRRHIRGTKLEPGVLRFDCNCGESTVVDLTRVRDVYAEKASKARRRVVIFASEL